VGVRVTLVYDKQPSGGAIPTFDTIFGRTDQSGTESTAYDDPIKYDNMSRFQVLKDIFLTDTPQATPPVTGTTMQVSSRFHVDEYVNVGRETVFSGQSTPMTIADVSTGALYLIFRASLNTTTTSEVQVGAASMARLRYVDV